MKERFINTYNPEWLDAWDANMDIQIALDPYAIITYIVSYVSKDESGMTGFLKEALSASYSASQEKKLKTLLHTYLTHRQVGLSEAVYRAIRDMKLKDSNIACIWLSTGFPENRYISFRKVSEEDSEEHEDDAFDEDDIEKEEVVYNKNRVKIQNKQGLYQQATSTHDRYSDRPYCLEEICLAQFASAYTYTSRVPKSVEFEENGHGASTNRSNVKIFGTDVTLPCYVRTSSSKFFRLRRNPAVLRVHASKRKEGHEQHFTELQLFYPWRDEVRDLLRNYPQACVELYESQKEAINIRRKLMYPGEDVIELMDFQTLEEMRPSHIFDSLNPEGEQQEEEDRAEGSEDDPNFAAYDHQGNLVEEDQIIDNYKYKSIEVPRDEDLLNMTRRLAGEQQLVLQEVLNFCKQVVRNRKNLAELPKPFRLIIHGGAGVGKSATIKTAAVHAENILRQAGSHPNKPRVLILAPTGKAASLIGKY